MELKTIWCDLKSALQSSVGLTTDTVNRKFYLNNQVLMWQRTGKRPVVPTADHEMDCSFNCTWNPGPEYLWLTELYRLGLTIKHSSNGYSYSWEAAITLDRTQSPARQDQSQQDVIAACLPYEMASTGVMFGGNSTNIRLLEPDQTKLTDVWPALRPLQTTFSSGFCASHKLAQLTKYTTECSPLHESMLAALTDTTVQPVSSVRLQTTSNCTYLAVETSRAVVRLFAMPIKPVTVDPTDLIEVICQTRTFSASLSRLTSVSSVIAACFQNDNFIESKERQFNLSVFSEATVEAFLHFCTHASVPRQMRTVCVELAQLSHLYEVKMLLVMCEIFLMRDLIFCGSVARLCDLTRVAVRLELPLLLATFDVVLMERQREWMRGKEARLRLEPWAAVMEELGSFESARLRAVLVLDSIQLADDGTVIRPTVG